jgi:hypothetical protein
VKGEVCSEKAQKELDRVSIVRDVRFVRWPLSDHTR